MARYARPPIVELSIAVQYERSFGLTPNHVLDIQRAIGAEFPKIEIREALGTMGTAVPPVATKTDDSVIPRFWFLSDDDYLLFQVQHDLVALNWRKRSQLGEPSTLPYPGF